ncbi:hypothetical protein CPB85DRAFT_1563953, partial [Mucidula mucida]
MVLIFDPPTTTRWSRIVLFLILLLRIKGIIRRRALILLRASFYQTISISRARRPRALGHKASRARDPFFGASSNIFDANIVAGIAEPNHTTPQFPLCNDHENILNYTLSTSTLASHWSTPTNVTRHANPHSVHTHSLNPCKLSCTTVALYTLLYVVEKYKVFLVR